MPTKIPYLERKAITILSQRAKSGRTIFYGELGEEVGIPSRGPWKPILDEIAHEETARGQARYHVPRNQ